MGITKNVDPKFAENHHPVIALVSSGRDTYVICRGEGAAAEVKQTLVNLPTQHVTSSEAFRVIPDAVKARLMISANSIVKLPETRLGEAVIALTEYADGSVNRNLLSAELQQAALQATSVKKR